MEENLKILWRISIDTKKETSTLAEIAKQNQKDSRMLKVLSIIATMYLPASLIVVRNVYFTLVFGCASI